jgi:hypothetical protein
VNIELHICNNGLHGRVKLYRGAKVAYVI